MSPSNKPHISRREYMKWENEEASEPTSTLVLTSPQNHFVDIRILENEPSKFLGIRPFSHLDWAFAGTSHTNTEGTHCKWIHFIDSRTPHPESVSDEGDIISSGPDRTLERGKMPHPKTGKLTRYEECWVTVDGGGDEFVVLVLQDDEKGERGMVVRVGRFVQGVVRAGEAFALERWVEGKREVRMGDLFVPCGIVMDGRVGEVGDEVRFEGTVWRVVEKGRF